VGCVALMCVFFVSDARSAEGCKCTKFVSWVFDGDESDESWDNAMCACVFLVSPCAACQLPVLCLYVYAPCALLSFIIYTHH